MGHDTSKHDHSRKGKPSSQPPSRPNPPSSTNYPSTMSSVQKYDLSSFAVITVIFNPVGYKSRYNHYQKFAAHMAQSGVQLYTVECIFESATRFGLPAQNFEVTRAGERRHIQLRAPSILWMKENLINIAIQRLPSNIEYIAWIDGDIEFERLDWPHLTINELQRYPIVQIFELSLFLGPGGKQDVLRRDYSFGYSIRHNKPINPQRYQDWYAHPGYAWAMRRSVFSRIGGLLDFCIIGSGDLHFAFALLRRIEETIRPDLHPDYRQLAVAWGERVAEAAQYGANVGYVPVTLYHHWHGERTDRNYVDRWLILVKHQYSPINDLEKNDDSGLLRLADKRRFGRADLVAQVEGLERDIVEYFKSRNEDKQAKENPVQRPKPVPAKPFVPAKTQDHRRAPPRIGGGGPSKPSRPFPSGFSGGIRHPPIWSSGHAGTHVDDDYPYGYPDDQHCRDPTDPNYPCDDDHHHHHQHCDDDDHHHYHDHHEDHHHHEDYHHHDDYNYGGAGSFY